MLVVRGDGMYGDLSNAVYWVKQSYFNCVLMASAMAVAQVTGEPTPAEALMVEIAKTSDSVETPGQKMYLDENIEDGVAEADAVVLMETNFGVKATLTKYNTVDDDGNVTAATLVDGQRALSDAEAALQQGKAIIAFVNSSVIWNAAHGMEASGTPNYFNSDHAVVVIAVDLKKGLVYLNDSGPEFGQGMAVPIGAFMNAWQSNDYETIVVEKAGAQSGPVAA